MRKILVVATYPIKNPQHGGQKRVDAIVTKYKDVFDEVKFVGVFSHGFYKEYSKDDISLGLESEKIVRESPLTGDIICGRSIIDDRKVRRKFTKLLLEFKPDIIHIEQPFAYLGIKPLLQELNISPKLIFGSQNIEAPMKSEILENAGVKKSEIIETTKLIHQLEAELSQDCNLLAACTDNDLITHQKMGATNTVLAKNGVAESRPKRADNDYWLRKFKDKSVQKTALFVGSAHPPNWIGFLEMVGKGLGFVSSKDRVVLAGSICDYFDNEIQASNLDIKDATFWLRAFSAGRLSENRLVALLNVCDVIILPITEGGGSNLKTAEAIISNKKVVATSHALRSFEWFKDFPNVWVADTKKSFQDSIKLAFDAPFSQRTEAQERKAKEVLWGHCLSGLMEEAVKL